MNSLRKYKLSSGKAVKTTNYQWATVSFQISTIIIDLFSLKDFEDKKAPFWHLVGNLQQIYEWAFLTFHKSWVENKRELPQLNFALKELRKKLVTQISKGDDKVFQIA